MGVREAGGEGNAGEADAVDGGIQAGAVDEAEAGGEDRGVGNPIPPPDHCHGYMHRWNVPLLSSHTQVH